MLSCCLNMPLIFLSVFVFHNFLFFICVMVAWGWLFGLIYSVFILSKICTDSTFNNDNYKLKILFFYISTCSYLLQLSWLPPIKKAKGSAHGEIKA